MAGSWAVGTPKEALNTPALLVDLDVLEDNIRRIATACDDNGKAWRPHIKGLKVAAIAHKALAAGAIGVTCAKLGEAEAMAASGIGEILIANQVVGPEKVRRLAGLARQARVTVAVDSMRQVEALAAAASAAGTRVGLVIEVDIGIKRAGAEPGPHAVALAADLMGMRNVEFRGFMGWEGHASAIANAEEKEAAVRRAVGALIGVADACRKEGIPVAMVSCGGTGTYWITARQPGVTELQAGGGIFGDVRYREKFGVDHPIALTVLTTVTSRPSPTRIICDAGKKSMNAEAPLSRPVGIGPVASVSLSAEHAAIEMREADPHPEIGEKVEFVVGYSDMTTHLHDTLFGVRNGLVEAAWPILERASAT